MRRMAFSLGVVVCAVGLWFVPPAMASHSPCSALDPVCIRVACPGPQPGYGWIYVNYDMIPWVDFTDCVGI